MRRQVQKEGGISFTNRFSLTQDFAPFDDEWEPYGKLAAYLSSDNLHAMQPSARHLVTIGMRKIPASSSFEILDTLKNMIDPPLINASRASLNGLIDDESGASLAHNTAKRRAIPQWVEEPAVY